MIIGKLTKSEIKVLNQMFSSPFEKYSLSFLAKKCNISYMSIFRSAKKLKDIGIINEVLICGKKVRVLNFKNQLLLKLLEIIEVEKKMAFDKNSPKLSKDLTDFSEKLCSVFREKLLISILTSSKPKGSLLKKPEVNVLLVFSEIGNFEHTISELSSKIHGYNISHNIITLDNFTSVVSQDSSFLSKLWYDMVILHGENVFWGEITKLNRNTLFSDRNNENVNGQ